MVNVNELRTALTRAMLEPLPKDHRHPDLTRFYKLIHTYPERQGKQLRGLFVLLAAEAHGGDWRDALPVAAALELFQNWVLIHDDIVDDSEERRGEPALHKQVGMPLALNVGDALHVYMWQTLHGISVELPRDAIWTEFTTMIHRTAEGQHLDLTWVEENRFDISEADYLEMVTLKTAFYTVVSPLNLGALCAGCTPNPAFVEIGKTLGAAFQIRDDVLNLIPPDPKGSGYGKEFAGDLYEAKRTLILAHLFAHATSDEQVEVTERLGKPRSVRTQEDVRHVLKLMDKYGSLGYVQSVAEQKAAAGLKQLSEVFAGLANQLAARKLSGLLESLASRTA